MLWTKRCMGLARAWKLVISNLNVTFLAHVNWINGSIVFSLWKIGSVANCWHTLYTLEAKWTSEFLHKELVVQFVITIERSPSSQFPFVWAFFLFKMFVYLLTLLMTFVCWWPFLWIVVARLLFWFSALISSPSMWCWFYWFGFEKALLSLIQ